MEPEIDHLLSLRRRANWKVQGVMLGAVILLLLLLAGISACVYSSEEDRYGGGSRSDEFRRLVISKESPQAPIWLGCLFAAVVVGGLVALDGAGDVVVYKVLLRPHEALDELRYNREKTSDDSNFHAGLGCLVIVVGGVIAVASLAASADAGFEVLAKNISWLLLGLIALLFIRMAFRVAKRVNFSANPRRALSLEWGRGYMLSAASSLSVFAALAFFALPLGAELLGGWLGGELEERIQAYRAFECRSDARCEELRKREIGEAEETLSRPVLPVGIAALEFTVAAERLNVRQGPSGRASVVGQLRKDESVRMDEIRGDWGRLAGDSGEGWVHLGYLRTGFGKNFRVATEWLVAKVGLVLFAAVVPLFVGVPLLFRWVEFSLLRAAGGGLASVVAARGLEVLVVERLQIMEPGSLGLILLGWLLATIVAVLFSQ